MEIASPTNWQIAPELDFMREYTHNFKWLEWIIDYLKMSPSVSPFVVYHLMQLRNVGFFNQKLNPLQFHIIFATLTYIFYKVCEDEPICVCKYQKYTYYKYSGRIIKHYEVQILKALNWKINYDIGKYASYPVQFWGS